MHLFSEAVVNIAPSFKKTHYQRQTKILYSKETSVAYDVARVVRGCNTQTKTITRLYSLF